MTLRIWKITAYCLEMKAAKPEAMSWKAGTEVITMKKFQVQILGHLPWTLKGCQTNQREASEAKVNGRQREAKRERERHMKIVAPMIFLYCALNIPAFLDNSTNIHAQKSAFFVMDTSFAS